MQVKRKTLLTRMGDTEKHLYFVVEGVYRSYYISPRGADATLVFFYPPSFAGVADSFLLQQPSKYFVESLTTGSLLRTNFNQVQQLMLQHRGFEQFVLGAVTRTLSGVLERQIELQCFSAEEKFRALLQRSPHVLQLIPHKYLASYLGIDATTFSKLLGSIKL
ncbi:MAG TPA: cyclic nucleotide-binding protein [Chitinophagaceae bacterium]|nr:cyclic nucleotide-binding protein [Chitinophagaceae bacterium]HAN39574.1 cyclic nucleotide-binding protein [Chitinophagaceae bacterium]